MSTSSPPRSIVSRACSAVTRSSSPRALSSISSIVSRRLITNGSGLRQNPEGHHCVLERRGDDHERVEDLVVAEDGRYRVWALEGVDKCAGGVEEASERDHRRSYHPQLADEVGCRGQHHPPERHVNDRDEPLRSVDPKELEQDA